MRFVLYVYPHRKITYLLLDGPFKKQKNHGTHQDPFFFSRDDCEVGRTQPFPQLVFPWSHSLLLWFAFVITDLGLAFYRNLSILSKLYNIGNEESDLTSDCGTGRSITDSSMGVFPWSYTAFVIPGLGLAFRGTYPSPISIVFEHDNVGKIRLLV